MSKKILFIVTKSEIGGAQKFVKEQIDILVAAGYECFLSTNKVGWLSKNTGSQVSNVLIDDNIERFSLKYLFRLRKFIIDNGIHLVICNSANGGFYGRIASFISNKRSIYVSHGWSSVYNGGKLSFVYNKIELLLSYLGNSVLCVSENDYSIARNKIGIPGHKLKLITNCIKPLPTKNSIILNDAKSSVTKILAVARLEYPKRVDLLIDAVKNIPNLHLSIIGDGNQFNAIRKKILDESILNVNLMGRKEGFDAFPDYDIFTLISESEGLPLSALEAMSCGNSLVLSNVGGCSELILDNGVLVDNTSDSILKGITECIDKLDFYKAGSKKLFSKKFDLNSNKTMYFNYYNEYLK